MSEHARTGGAAIGTPLEALHVELGARMVEYAGFRLPLHYPPGIRAEHRHTREAASLFDVSHMGQVHVRGERAAAMLEALIPADLAGLAPGRMRYGLFTLDGGGVLDDLMATRIADGFALVVNASRRAEDLAHLGAAAGDGARVELRAERALLALQGPGAVQALAALAPDAAALRFMHAAALDVAGVACEVSRSGYTGEDGFEIGCAAAAAEGLARALLARPGVAAAGLGARDTLRLEAGLCLYGHELDASTTPIEAGLAWAVPRVRRPGGARAGGYPGADVIGRELAQGPPRLRVGLVPDGRAPVRDGAELVDAGGAPAGRVTSGGFGFTFDGPVAMALVRADLAAAGTPLTARARGRELPVRVRALPFVAHRYAR